MQYNTQSTGSAEEPRFGMASPFTPRTGKRADVTDPETWGTFDEVHKAYESGKWAGIGLALVSGLVAIDIDDCLFSGNLHPRVEKVIRYLNTYFEESPGEGARGFMYGTIPGIRRRRGKYELYNESRYVTVTGRRISFAPPTINTNQERLDRFYKYIFPPSSKQEKPRSIHTHRGEDTTTIIENAMQSASGSTCARYYHGDSSLWGEAGKHNSKSEADFQFCLQLVYWTNGNAARMDAIFRESGLYDEKWDERRGKYTYGERTIANALKISRYK